MYFNEFQLSPNILRAVEQAGFKEATPIQERAIPALLQGHNVIGIAQTGTGKTAAYGLPLLQRLRNEAVIQALVMVPTRELATQVTNQLSELSPQHRVVAVFGGQPFPVQLNALRKGAHVIVGTPGRLLDHLRRQTISLKKVHFCVLDEADEMLDFGFQEDMEAILAELPLQEEQSGEVQIALFSATTSDRVEKLASQFIRQPMRIEIEAKTRTVDRIDQTFCLVHAAKKIEVLGRILDFDGAARAESGGVLVFCRTRAECQEVSDTLRERNYLAESLHGDMAQSERDRVMDRFRRGQCRLLVATDVAARGLDVDNVTHVVNYSIPRDIDQYIHRVGRTARAGRSGMAVNLVTPREQRHIEWIEKMSGASIRNRAIPSLEELRIGKSTRFQQLIEAQMEDANCQTQLSVANKLARKYGMEALAAGLLHMLWTKLGFEMPTNIDDSEELGPTPRSGKRKREEQVRGERPERGRGVRGDRDGRAPRGDREGRGPRERDGRPVREQRERQQPFARPVGDSARAPKGNRDSRRGESFARDSFRGEGASPVGSAAEGAPSPRASRDYNSAREMGPRPERRSSRAEAAPEEGRPKRREKAPARVPDGRDKIWLKFSVGNREGLSKNELMEALTNSGQLTKGDIFNVVIEDRKSMVEIPAGKGEEAVRNLKRFKLAGKRTKVDFFL